MRKLELKWAFGKSKTSKTSKIQLAKTVHGQPWKFWATRKMQPSNAHAYAPGTAPSRLKLRIVESDGIVPRCIGATHEDPLDPDLPDF
jgi:hypothetical protein